VLLSVRCYCSDFLPREWHELYRKEVLPTLKCIGHAEVVSKARLRVDIKQNERAAILNKLSQARVKAQMCGNAARRRKREAACAKLETREQAMQVGCLFLDMYRLSVPNISCILQSVLSDFRKAGARQSLCRT
jgi:hypothetical protein